MSISIAVVSARFHVVGLGQSLRLSFCGRFSCRASADADNGTEARPIFFACLPLTGYAPEYLHQSNL